MSNSQGIASVAEALLKTLNEEQDALNALADQFERQIDAVRNQQLQAIEEATAETNELVSRLDRLRRTQEGQTRLLSRVLGVSTDDTSLEELVSTLSERQETQQTGQKLRSARRELRAQADAAQRHCEELEFALQYAVSLGREMLGVLQDLDVPPSSSVYTKSGQTTRSSSRSFLNEVG